MAVFTHGGLPVTHLAWSPAGARFLLTLAGDASLCSWSPKDGGRMLARLAGPRMQTGEEGDEFLTSFAFHPGNEAIVITATSFGRLFVRDLNTPAAPIKELASPHSSSVPDSCSIERVAFSNSAGSMLLMATASLDGRVAIWDASRMTVRTFLKHRPEPKDSSSEVGVTTLVWSHSVAAEVFTASSDGVVRRWNALTGDCLNTWHARSLCAVLDLTLSRLVPMVVAAMDDGSVAVFDYDLSH